MWSIPLEWLSFSASRPFTPVEVLGLHCSNWRGRRFAIPQRWRAALRDRGIATSATEDEPGRTLAGRDRDVLEPQTPVWRTWELAREGDVPIALIRSNHLSYTHSTAFDDGTLVHDARA